MAMEQTALDTAYSENPAMPAANDKRSSADASHHRLRMRSIVQEMTQQRKTRWGNGLATPANDSAGSSDLATDADEFSKQALRQTADIKDRSRTSNTGLFHRMSMWMQANFTVFGKTPVSQGLAGGNTRSQATEARGLSQDTDLDVAHELNDFLQQLQQLRDKKDLVSLVEYEQHEAFFAQLKSA